MTTDPLHKYLAANGWKNFPLADFDKHESNWAKKFDTPTECRCNEGKRMQIILAVWPRHRPEFPRTVEASVTGEIKSGQWVKLQVYTMTEHGLGDHLDFHCAALLRAWEAIAQ